MIFDNTSYSYQAFSLVYANLRGSPQFTGDAQLETAPDEITVCQFRAYQASGCGRRDVSLESQSKRDDSRTPSTGR